MDESTSPEPSPAPLPESHSNGASAPVDFNAQVAQAQETGNFNVVLDTAMKSKKMLVEFRDAVRNAPFDGKDCASVAMGLNFLDNMVNNASQQLAMLKQTAKATMEAIKATERKDGN